MKFLVQRVSSATVINIEDNQVVGEIKQGLLVLVGVGNDDTIENADKIIKKLLNLRVMADGNKKMNLSLIDSKGELLIVSQFTLYANTKDGNRPSFVNAADPESARKLYNYIIEKCKEIVPTSTGSFGHYMKINAELDGPVTILLEE